MVRFIDMASEHNKGLREVAIFQQFLGESGLPIERSSIEKQHPPKPDIYCVHSTRGGFAFELVEICDSNIAQLISQAVGGNAAAIWTSDPLPVILRKKLSKSYDTEFPVNLLVYTDGRTVTPDDVVLSRLRPILESRHGAFEQAWFLGNGGAHLIWCADR